MTILKRHLKLWLFAVASLAALSAPATAQTTGDDWNVTFAPYLMGAGMSGSTTLRGNEVTIDASASDVIENLEFGFMGFLVARKGNWGIGGDAVWMALGTTVQNTNVDFNQGAFAFYGLRRLGAAADLTFGLRVNTLQGELTFNQLGRVVDQSQNWVDPIAGLLLRTPADHRLQLKVYSEIGGFGAGSDFTWQFYPTLGIKLANAFSLEFGYRWLDIDYTKGDGNDRFVYDVLAQGPVMGFAFRF